jgi:hypothetical protein
MLHPLSKQLPLGVFLALLLTVPVYAGKNYKISNYGKGHQIWFEAEDFDERDPDTDAGFALSDEPGAFGRSITNTSGTDGAYLLRYDFDISDAGGKGGTWYFWGRVINPNNRSSFMLVDGHPGDPTPVTSLPVTGLVNGQRIFEQSLGDTWTWARTNHGEAHTKTLRDGLNTMYILSREDLGIMDVFLWTDDPDYQPTDDDYRNAKALLPGTALTPGPGAGATDAPQDALLSWEAGKFAGSHDVYFGTAFEDVNSATRTVAKGVLVSQGQTETTFDPAGVFMYGQTYYWRIDEVNQTPDNYIFKGTVWSFTVEPYGYPIKPMAATASSAQAEMGPEKTIDGSGLTGDLHGTDENTMWMSAGAPNWIQYEFDQVYRLDSLQVWNSNQLIESFIGFGAKTVTVETSLDGTAWTPVADVPEFAKAPGAPGYAANTTVNLGGVEARYVKLTISANWGLAPQAGLSEVRFSYIPVRARAPQPATDAQGININTSLDWRPGRGAASHTVYFGTDANAVANGTVAGQTVTEHSYAPGSLTLDTTYYWRVDEVNAVTYPGSVWSFTTQAYAVVEDFESYTDQAGEEIFSAWIDGFTDGTNGSTVGSLTAANGTFGETTIFHGGKQSMPLAYDNTPAPNYSEATLTFDGPRNWTASGIKSLSLWFQGAAGNGGQLYLKINNTKVAYNGGTGDLAKTAWLPWNVDLSTVGGNLSKVNSLTIGIEGTGAKGILYVDDIRLYPKAPVYYAPADPGKVNLKALWAFEGNANDTSGSGLNGTLKQAQVVASGRSDGGSAVKVEKVGYVDLGNPPALDFATGDWTFTAWYKTAITGTGDANKGTIFSKGGDSTGGKRYGLIMSETVEGVLTLVTDDDVTKYVVDSKSKTNDDQWHFVAAQREGTTLRIYIDGQLEGSMTIPAAYDLSGTSQHNAYIGAMTNNTDGSMYKLYNGLIDDVRVYNRALTIEEILWLAGRTGPVAQPF